MTSSISGNQVRALSFESRALLEQASSWLSDAMNAWSEGAHTKVTALAPLSLEVALKAYLWNVNPALLVPLDRQQESSLIELTTTSKITDDKLRTVGLADALRRAITVARTEPRVDKKRRDRVVSCRNGAVHMGIVGPDVGRYVLTDCITLLSWVLHLTQYPESDFFGENLDDCRDLITQRRSEAEQAVMAKLSKHRRQFDRLQEALDDSVWMATIDALEASAMTDYWPSEEHAPEVIPARHECPACRRSGALYGVVEIEGEADIEEKHGERTVYGYWRVTLNPEFFVCNVCRMRLWGPQELEPAGLPFDVYQPTIEDLGDFDPGDY